MEFDYNKHLIYMTLSGSRAYGINTPESDYDYRGIIIPPTIYYDGFLHSFDQKEGLEGYGQDSVAYNIIKFFKLAANCNPNILEILFVPDDLITVNTEYGEMIRSRAHDFLSKKAEYSFHRYAYAQLKRIKGHKRWWDREKGGEPKKPNREARGLPSRPKYSKDILNGLFSVPWNLLIGSEAQYVAKERLYFVDKQKYDKWKDWKNNRNPKRAAIEEKYGYDCYTDDTEFLTKKGWKCFDEVESLDKLATVIVKEGKDFGKIEHQSPIDRIDGVFTGDLYNLVGRHTDVLVTPNHRMLTRKVERKSLKKSKWVLEEVAIVPDTFEVLRSITPLKKKNLNDVLSSTFPLSIETYLRLMGWFLSDGTFRFRGNKLKSISISQKKNGKLSSGMIKFSNRYKNSSLYRYERKPNKWRPYKIEEQVLNIRDKDIVQRLYEDCGHKDNKRIPRWVFGLSKRLMEILFDSMRRGDDTIKSHKTIDNNFIYYSSLKGLADDVNELAFYCGWETSLWGPYEKKEEGGLTGRLYQVFVDKGKPKVQKFYRNANIRNIRVVDQRIVCFTVPNGTLVTRRRGKIAIHGNCKHATHLVRLMTMCEEILRDHEVVVRRPDAEFLIGIRNGKLTYDELMEWVVEQDKKLEELFKKSTLREKPDVKALNALCVQIVERARNENFGK
jgi:hypothetical protein